MSLDVASEILCAQVMVDTPAGGADRVFDYAVPPGIAGELGLGQWVRVPFGRRETQGLVVGLGEPPGCPVERLREIAGVVSDDPPLTPEMVLVARWMAEYYVCTFSQAIRCFLPRLPRPKGARRAPALVPGQEGALPAPGGAAAPASEPPYRLTAAQEQALAAFESARQGGRPLLLHGVPDSGKTEVYLQAIARVLAEGRQALFLVPEIALAPQSLERVVGRFGAAIVVWHHQMNATERWRAWESVRAGVARAVVGVRSAVFAPFAALGLVILDEEHEPAYKQDETPRYHAREVALRRAAFHGAAVILGSATPSLESYARAERQVFALAELPERVDSRQPPIIRAIDMRRELLSGNRSVLSRPLLAALRERLIREEQAILFLNRRGLAGFLLCRECGQTLRCPDCAVSFTYHQTGLLCHYCGRAAERPQACPTCGGEHLFPFGAGTQKVETHVAQAFPQARVLRLDTDTTGRKGAAERILGAFRRKEADVLVGTQMVAKGLDIPGVTLVGVVSADVALHLPDFRAAERTFQLLLQVAGRAGRGARRGEVIVQTYAPEHPAIQLACALDYAGFYRAESLFRERVGYPPAQALIRIVWSGPESAAVEKAAEQAVAPLTESGDAFWAPGLIGPSPAPLARLATKFRWHALLRGPLADIRRVAQRYVDEARSRLERAGVAVAVDVEPLSLL